MDQESGYRLRGVNGVKTGTTEAAGRCLVVSYLWGERSYLIVLLGAPYSLDSAETAMNNLVFEEAQSLILWAEQEAASQGVQKVQGTTAPDGDKAGGTQDQDAAQLDWNGSDNCIATCCWQGFLWCAVPTLDETPAEKDACHGFS
jgi:D-alanyl-D-alanine carboxypeptidase